MKLSVILAIIFAISTNSCASQNNKCLKDINNQIWANFSKAFETLDSDLFESIHSNNLVRVSGDNKTIRDKTTYINGYKKRWKNSSINQSISFRFLERVCNENKASERGIYKLIIKPDTKEENIFYGKFHVIHRKENGKWKVLVDYDSSEYNTINKTSYERAFSIENFDTYKKPTN